jgi:hypothetical protein
MPCLGLVSFVRALPAAVAYTGELFAGGRHPPPDPTLAALAQFPLRGKELVICSDRAGYFHMHSQSWSALPFSSTSEVVLKADIVLIQELLDRNGPLVVAFRERDGGLMQIAKHLDLTKYRVVDEREQVVLLALGRMFSPARSPRASSRLKSSMRPRRSLSVDFSTPASLQKGIACFFPTPPTRTPPSFTDHEPKARGCGRAARPRDQKGPP